jgi:hypothetical protein
VNGAGAGEGVADTGGLNASGLPRRDRSAGWVGTSCATASPAMKTKSPKIVRLHIIFYLCNFYLCNFNRVTPAVPWQSLP